MISAATKKTARAESTAACGSTAVKIADQQHCVAINVGPATAVFSLGKPNMNQPKPARRCLPLDGARGPDHEAQNRHPRRKVQPGFYRPATPAPPCIAARRRLNT
jgi:hypothetical protein